MENQTIRKTKWKEYYKPNTIYLTLREEEFIHDLCSRLGIKYTAFLRWLILTRLKELLPDNLYKNVVYENVNFIYDNNFFRKISEQYFSDTTSILNEKFIKNNNEEKSVTLSDQVK
ncbi:hypothetical protein [Saccharolobus islandicus]|uniref:Uncharacterized protein n=1 Tax=Saccharolobus islandicus (strain M.16.4 / Kamchatka \|nr:hypothetical protein [Sulfolobus islandicus]ACR41514.1 hypothetical protein M164_0902 [Sulfolobus islandicus M.16.4]